MKIKQYCLLAAALGLISACKNDEKQADVMPAPQVQLSVTDDKLLINAGDTLIFSALAIENSEYTSQWILNGETVSDATAFQFVSKDKGPHTLVYKANNEGGEFTKTYTIEISYAFNNPYVTQLLDYKPAPGQFINASIGTLASAESLLGKTGLTTLGAWGGYVVLGFDHRVLDQTDKEDIVIYGNPQATLAEPAVVYVMRDENENGLADDTWYQVAGSEFSNEVRDYSVTYTRPDPITADVPWTDNKGNSGVVKTNNFHKQAYYPEWITESTYTLSGSLLPSSNIDKSNSSFIKSLPFAFGYADNTVGGDKIDIANAVDANGEKVSLKGIDFIKLQTGIQADLGWLGELSTEVAGVADLSLLK